MRNLVFVILLCLPGMLSAQSWNITAGGGIVLNTITSRPSPNEKQAGPGGAASLQAGYTRNHWEAGLGAAFRRYAVRIEGDYYFEDDFDPLTGYPSGPPYHLRFLETFPAIAITPFINRHFGSGRADWYAGISGGYAVILEQQYNPDRGANYVAIRKAADGFTAGAQAGCAYRLRKRWSLRGELSADGLWLKAFSLQDAIVTAGVRYTIR